MSPNMLTLTFYGYFHVSVLSLESTCQIPISNVKNILSILKKKQETETALYTKQILAKFFEK